MDLNGKTTTKLRLKRAQPQEQKVYDLDSAPADAVLNKSFEAIPRASESGELPQGMILCGHDNVRDVVADFESVGGSTSEFGSVSTLKPVAIELPSDSLMAGEKASGIVRLNEPSIYNTVVMLHSSDENVLAVPADVIVVAGKIHAEFPIKTSNPWRATANVTIHALLPDESMFAQSISVRYNLGLAVR